jgi:hypothetical protein
MKIFLVTILLVAPAVSQVTTPCQCLKPQPEETTHWVGNLQVIFVEKTPYRQLRGMVQKPDGSPLSDALVEVFTNPGYLLIDKPISKQGRPNQRRVAACRTGPDGLFCFSNLPAGKYEIRSSSDDTRTGWNASQVYVLLNPRSGKKRELIVEMTLGI